jgi:Uma2 family endonuclease
MAIEVEIPRRRFTVEEYHRMAEVGIFHPDERVELIEGEIVQMSPIGPRQSGCVINATRLFITRLGDRAVVSPQNPVVIRPAGQGSPLCAGAHCGVLAFPDRASWRSTEPPAPTATRA